MKKIRLLILSVLIVISFQAYPQIDLKGKIKNQTSNRANDRVDQGIDRGLDKVEEGIGSIFKKKEKKENPGEEAGEEAEENEGQGDASQAEEATESNAEEKIPDAPKPQERIQSYTKYDFVPGDQILYFDDFSQDAIGDFPALWTTNGSGEVKTINIAEGQWFHMNGTDAVYSYVKKLTLPENFIFEFDIIPDGEYRYGQTLTLYQEDPEDAQEMNPDLYPGIKGLHIAIKKEGWETKGYWNDPDKDWLTGQGNKNPVLLEQVNHVIIWIQKRRVRIYHQGAKVLDMPTNIHEGTVFERLRFSGWDSESFPMVSNLKITTAAPDTRSKLITEGKLVSYGISFDSGKDVVKPESYGALNDIAKVLKENPDVKIRITGHTDSDGNDALNLDLSKRRALSVKNELADSFGIELSRMETDGKGESQPLSPNDSAEGKAKNRRVEFTKL